MKSCDPEKEGKVHSAMPQTSLQDMKMHRSIECRDSKVGWGVRDNCWCSACFPPFLQSGNPSPQDGAAHIQVSLPSAVKLSRHVFQAIANLVRST